MPKRRLKPTEVRAVAALLDEEAESAEELAERVVRKLNDMREGERQWVVAMTIAGEADRRKLVAVWGPYTSHLSARRDALKHIPGVGRDCRASIYRLGNSGTQELT